MISKDQAIGVLLRACPSFERSYATHVEDHGDDLPYVAAGELARHLLELHQAGMTESLSTVGKAIERLHVEGSPWVKEFATIGILEGVQTAWSSAGAEPSAFVAYVGPESRRWWQSLEHFWSGKTPTVQSARQE